MPMVDDESECCGCGKKGCLEQYASANGLVRVAERYIAANRDVATKLDLNAASQPRMYAMRQRQEMQRALRQ